MTDETIPLPAPSHLSPAARELWIAIVSEYRIDQAAGLILATALESWDRREQARQALLRDGCVALDRFNQPKASPWCAIERDAALILHRSFRLLGMDQEPRPPKAEDGD